MAGTDWVMNNLQAFDEESKAEQVRSLNQNEPHQMKCVLTSVRVYAVCKLVLMVLLCRRLVGSLSVIILSLS